MWSTKIVKPQLVVVHYVVDVFPLASVRVSTT